MFTNDPFYNQVSFANIGQDRQSTYTYTHASLADAIACSIAMIVVFSSVIGRIQALEVIIMVLFGTFLYEVNSQLLWRLVISDIGYGMRIFIFASFMGVMTGFLLDKRPTTVDSPKYMSTYASRAIGLLGLVIIFCCFPFLCVAGLYHTSVNLDYILYIGPFNMWLALGAGVLGSFSASALTYKKISVHDLIFSGISGGIAYSSSCNIHRNPSVPMSVGFACGFFVSLFHSVQLRNMNKKGVLTSLAAVSRFLIPGLISGFLSAILYAVGQGNLSVYRVAIGAGRSEYGQGGFQIIGMLISLGIGLLAGVIVGLLFKVMNKQKSSDQFNDNAAYQRDEPKVKVNRHIVENNP